MTTATQSNHDVILYTEPEGGWEPDGNEELTVPKLPTVTIVQPTSGWPDAHKHVGEFWHSDYEYYTPTLEGVVLVRKDSRALFEQGASSPVCMSADGKTPVENMPLWTMHDVNLARGVTAVTHAEPPDCGRCFFSQWEGDRNHRTPPACGLSYVLLMVRETSDLCQFRFKGASLRPYKEWVQSELSPSRIQPQGAKIFTRRVTFATDVKTESGKKWAELTIQAERLPQGEAEKYNRMLAEHRGHFLNEADDRLPFDE